MKIYDALIKVIQKKHPYIAQDAQKKIKVNAERATYKCGNTIISFFRYKPAFISYLKYYRISSPIIDTPRIIDSGSVLGYYYIIFPYIESKNNKMSKSKSYLLSSAHVLGKLHKRMPQSKANLYYLVEKAMKIFLKGIPIDLINEIEALIKTNKEVFQDAPCLIHGDFTKEHLLMSDKIYLIDFDACKYFDFYHDLCSAFVSLCRKDKKLFRVFLQEYQQENDIIFSDKRFLINLIFYYLALRPQQIYEVVKLLRDPP